MHRTKKKQKWNKTSGTHVQSHNMILMFKIFYLIFSRLKWSFKLNAVRFIKEKINNDDFVRVIARNYNKIMDWKLNSSLNDYKILGKVGILSLQNALYNEIFTKFVGISHLQRRWFLVLWIWNWNKVQNTEKDFNGERNPLGNASPRCIVATTQKCLE